ncbi:hypothetical protein [Cohnella nanjingensis]|uniref:Right handed beta helix domain-containing protein n=1 Tax=Cohnella nanjingensis TaxID=1387779 RepID=A0A7X0VEA2_9BACL|nr:hypothetical protein [Cohnella nanjingensis]MBB6670792.1 hypothetical protein [Cohnella nanjingensis]
MKKKAIQFTVLLSIFFAMLFLFAHAGEVYAAPSQVNDTNGAITYSGSWTYDNTVASGYYNNDQHYSNTNGNYAQFTFTGTSIQWIGPKNFDCGISDVYIDGIKVASVDMYSSTLLKQQVLYSINTLTNASHTIKIVVTNTKNSSSSGYYSSIDSFSYVTLTTTTTGNDTNGAIAYSGLWTYDNTGASGYFNNDQHYSNTNGNYAQFTFTGTSIQWIGPRHNDCGISDVYIDGVKVASVDMYSSTWDKQQVLYGNNTLSNASHTIKIVVTNTKNASSIGYYSSIDAFKYDTPTPGSWMTSMDYSNIQGLNQWYYQQQLIASPYTYSNMSYVSGAWRGGGGNWISTNSAHPDNSNNAVRTWVAPVTGTVKITGRVFKIDTSGGDGVVVTVDKNSTPLWTRTISAGDWLGAFMDGALDSVSVAAGDYIHFIVNRNTDYGADATGWDPTITYIGTAPTNTTYYISAAGDDRNSGTDSAHPWKTVAPLNNINTFGAGVQILFHGGDTFTGGLNLSMVGTSGSRDIIGTYGTGKATLTDTAQSITDIIQLVNSEYVTVQNLNLIATPGTNYGTTSFAPVNLSVGLRIYSTRTSGSKWRSIYVDNCEFKNSQSGVWFDSHQGPTVDGFDDVKVTNSLFDSVYLLGVIVHGYDSFGPNGPLNQHSNVYIGSNQFKHIYGYHDGIAAESQPIEITNTTGLTIEKNLLADNCGYGGYNPLGGSTGIGISHTRDFKIQYNEIYGTKSSTNYDGSAIDADVDSKNGEIAFNLTYNNYGPSIQLGSSAAIGTTTSDIAIHHNISYNDVRGNLSTSVQGAVRIWGNTNNIQLFNNTIYVDKSGSQGTPSVISLEVGNNKNLKVWNNIFKTTSGVAMIRPNGSTGMEWDYFGTHIDSSNQFIANLYDSSGGTLIISTDDTHGSYTNVTSLSSWQGYGQEKIDATTYGVVGSAGLTSLTAPSGYLPSQQVSVFTNFDLTAGSAALGQAHTNPWSIVTLSGSMSVQQKDYHGNTASIVDIGADTY